ncbi:MAG: deoxyhypusine synthase family protein [Myxococcales bacterium]|nr:MAG: deoxyhypusine synthase family protein [Myxococcales bacterium]
MSKNDQFEIVKSFMVENYRHFNAASVVDAAEAYVSQLKAGNKMMVTLAGAMSTAELGISLAEMIRQDKVHIICCTGANLEEDVFNLVAHNEYVRIKDWRALTVEQEEQLLEKGLNRVTDTCIPEDEAMRKIEHPMIGLWSKADQSGQRMFPYQFFYELLKSGALKKEYQIDPKNSWLLAAMEKNLPIVTPGYEDSTLGNMFVSNVIKGKIKNINTIKSGLEQMHFLIDWYQENTKNHGIGFFQIGGGIAGDFPICVVPLIAQDLEQDSVRRWSYFCQISDSTTSFGSYSGAVPNEKITWGKLEKSTPKYIIESDATIVAPLMFAYILAS